MKCSNCGSGVEKGWKHCPHCGMRLGPYGSRGDMLSQLFKEMEDMTKGVGFKLQPPVGGPSRARGTKMDRTDRDMEVIDISNMLESMMKSMEGPNRRGFSLRIHQKNDEQPKVVFRRIGYGQPKRGIIPRLRKLAESRPPAHKLGIKLPQETSEPETEIRRSGNRVLVDIRLPGVKNSGDIDISELENSVEIKAVAGNSGYFKIIRKPEFSKIVKRSFDKGLLRLELL